MNLLSFLRYNYTRTTAFGQCTDAKCHGFVTNTPAALSEQFKCVYLAGDDASGAFRRDTYNRETGKLTLMYTTPDGTVYALLQRMRDS